MRPKLGEVLWLCKDESGVWYIHQSEPKMIAGRWVGIGRWSSEDIMWDFKSFFRYSSNSPELLDVDWKDSLTTFKNLRA